MCVRGFLCFYRAPLLVSRQNTRKSNYSPRYATLCRKSNVSPTYAKTGGCTPRKMSARRHVLSLFSPSSLSTLFLFNCLRTLSFSVAHLSPVPPTLFALFPKKPGGIPPARSYQVSSRLAKGC